MSERKSSALVKIEPYSPFGEAANGVRVAQYLLSDELCPTSALPRHIDFGLYSPLMGLLYREYRNVYRYSPSQRQAAFDIIEATKRQHPIFSSMPREWFAEVEDEFLEMVNQKAAGERLAVVYQDPTTKVAGVSTTSFGEYSSVSNQVVDRLKADGKNPFLKFHTHPTDCLFSPNDYYQMVAPSEEGKPFFKGQLVLCPTLQIMALTTDQTSLMPANEARELIEIWRRIATGESGEGKMLIEAMKDIENAHVEWSARHTQPLSEMQQLVGQGRIKRRDRRRSIREVEKSQRRHDAMTAKHNATLGEARNALEMYSNGKLNEFARVINVALYMSTNSRDFYRFSA